MRKYHLAQVNVALAKAEIDAPLMAAFVAQLDEINALADGSPGFVWRLQSDSGNATDVQAYDDPKKLVNMSLWETPKHLFDYVYKSGHTAVMVRRKEWFQRWPGPYQALWWLPAGTLPSVSDAMARLDHLARHGPTPHAFTFKQNFPSPDGTTFGIGAKEADAARCA